ncbi:MAG: flagellar FlbD family protein [bacterium]|nr:flagellar FlbD family protein [bacterium]
MIKLTRLNNVEFIISAHQIETIEETPDTIITLVSGRKILVKESAMGIVDKIISYRQKIGHGVNDANET